MPLGWLHAAVATLKSAVLPSTNARREIILPSTRFVRVGLSPFAKRERMNVIDLQRGSPPRWSDAVAGIVWLPRLAAKVRAHDAGTLGTYLLGQSPVDDEFLQAAQLTYADFIALVRIVRDDADLPAAIGARSPGAIERLRLWSLEMPVRNRIHMSLLDLDDGYTRPAWLDLPLAAVNAALTPLIALLRFARPLKA
jgi:hypothetical protein